MVGQARQNTDLELATVDLLRIARMPQKIPPAPAGNGVPDLEYALPRDKFALRLLSRFVTLCRQARQKPRKSKQPAD